MRALGLFLFLLLSFPHLVQLGYVADYLMDYERYAYALCENKNRPELNCNGKCVLAEKLALQDFSSPAPQLPSILEVEWNSFYACFSSHGQCSFETDVRFLPHVPVYFWITDGPFMNVPTPPPRILAEM